MVSEHDDRLGEWWRHQGTGELCLTRGAMRETMILTTYTELGLFAVTREELMSQWRRLEPSEDQPNKLDFHLSLRCPDPTCPHHPAEDGWRWVDWDGPMGAWSLLSGEKLRRTDANLRFDSFGRGTFEMVLDSDGSCAECQSAISFGAVVWFRPLSTEKTGRFHPTCMVCLRCARRLILGDEGVADER